MSADPGHPTGTELRHARHDLAHQMATVRALVDAASDRDLGDADRARALVAARTELMHAADLVAALGAGAPPDRWTTTTDLAAVVRTAAAAHVPERVCARVPGATDVALDRTATLRVVRNLLGNAIAAAGSDGHVCMVVTETGGRAQLDVHDDGPGPGPGGFSRAGGSGLDIVRSLVLPAGGWLVLGRSPRGGALATVVLPGATT